MDTTELPNFFNTVTVRIQEQYIGAGKNYPFLKPEHVLLTRDNFEDLIQVPKNTYPGEYPGQLNVCFTDEHQFNYTLKTVIEPYSAEKLKWFCKVVTCTETITYPDDFEISLPVGFNFAVYEAAGAPTIYIELCKFDDFDDFDDFE